MSVLATYAGGAAAVVGLVLGWAAVQHAWRRTFAERLDDADALAGRPGCHGCARTERCAEPQRRGDACRAEER